MRPVIAESPGEQQVGDWGGGQRGTEARTTPGSRQQPKQEQVCSVEFRCGPGGPQHLDSEGDKRELGHICIKVQN